MTIVFFAGVILGFILGCFAFKFAIWACEKYPEEKAFVVTWWYDYEESEVIAVFSAESAAKDYINAHAASAGEDSNNYAISEHEIDLRPSLDGVSKSDRMWGPLAHH